MNDDTLFDRLRARAEGRLSPAEGERLERELRGDSRLAEVADEYGAVHALTGAGDVEPPECRVRFEDLQARIRQDRSERRRPVALRRVAAAAGFAALLGAGAFLWKPGDATAAPVVLQAIALDPPVEATGSELAPPPPLSLDFDPRGPDGVRWITDLEDASWLADVAGRPLLVYGTLEGCPMCAVLDAEVFLDPAVVDLFERYVPVRLDIATLPPKQAKAMMARAYPFLEVWDARHESRFLLSNHPDPGRFLESMHDGLEAAEATGHVPSWETVRALSGLLVTAQNDVSRGSMAAAQRSLEVLSERATPGAFADLADRGLRRIAAEARERLLEARRADPQRAERLLREAARRFDGTPWGADLRAVLERLERDGRFPEIAGLS